MQVPRQVWLPQRSLPVALFLHHQTAQQGETSATRSGTLWTFSFWAALSSVVLHSNWKNRLHLLLKFPGVRLHVHVSKSESPQSFSNWKTHHKEGSALKSRWEHSIQLGCLPKLLEKNKILFSHKPELIQHNNVRLRLSNCDDTFFVPSPSRWDVHAYKMEIIPWN